LLGGEEHPACGIEQALGQQGKRDPRLLAMALRAPHTRQRQ
jgi:hypothetical protein